MISEVLLLPAFKRYKIVDAEEVHNPDYVLLSCIFICFFALSLLRDESCEISYKFRQTKMGLLEKKVYVKQV